MERDSQAEQDTSEYRTHGVAKEQRNVPEHLDKLIAPQGRREQLDRHTSAEGLASGDIHETNLPDETNQE